MVDLLLCGLLGLKLVFGWGVEICLNTCIPHPTKRFVISSKKHGHDVEGN
jgi:hypothetical protein